VGVELGGLVVVELEDELLHPARPSAPTANRAIDQLRTRGMGFLSDGGRAAASSPADRPGMRDGSRPPQPWGVIPGRTPRPVGPSILPGPWRSHPPDNVWV
jgi:hypothetical protein